MKHQLLSLISVFTLIACGATDDANRVVGELASDRIELTAEFSEPVIEIAVAEGESVSSGQVLLRQDDARAQARLADAEAAEVGDQISIYMAQLEEIKTTAAAIDSLTKLGKGNANKSGSNGSVGAGSSNT